MSIFAGRARQRPPDGERVSAVTWRGLPQPAVWQEIGAFDRPPGNLVIDLTPGPQRRNGVGDISSNYMSMPNPNWQQQRPIVTPGTQRSQGSPPQQGPSSYGVYRMRAAVLAAQMNQSGAQLVPFLQQNQGS